MKTKAIYPMILALVLVGVGSFYTITYIQKGKSYAATPLVAIEKVRGKGFVDREYHEAAVSDGVVLLFLRDIQRDSIVVSAEYVREYRRGWKWATGGGHTGVGGATRPLTETIDGEPVSYMQLLQDVDGEKLSSPIVFGLILDPDIDHVIVKDLREGTEQQAVILQMSEGRRMYYVAWELGQGEQVELKAYKDDGTLVFSKMIDDDAAVHLGA